MQGHEDREIMKKMKTVQKSSSKKNNSRLSGIEENILYRKSMMSNNKSSMGIGNNDNNGTVEEPKINNFVMEEKDNPESTFQTKIKKISFHPTCKDKLLSCIDHSVYKIFYFILTAYILFMDDIKMLCTDKDADIVFSIITIFIMVFFIVEIIIYFIIYDSDYSCQLYFWIDILGLASMVLDLHWVNDLIIHDFSSSNNTGLNSKTQGIVRLSRGVRIVTRSIRIIRIIKLLKFFKAKINKDNDEDEQEESKVGQKIEELTIKRVMVLILAMVVSMIIFNPNFYYDSKTVMDFGIQIFNDINRENELFNFTFNIYIEESLQSETPIVYIKAYGLEWGDMTKADKLRPIERIEVWDLCKLNKGSLDNERCYAIFNNKISLKFASVMNIIKTLFICIIVAGGVASFSQATNDLVIEPIGNMTKKIKDLSKNPIAAMQENLQAKEEHNDRNLIKNAISCCTNSQKKETPLETIILEKTISKISTLLALGFGEAGAEIISTNMKGGDGDVNPMVPGKKVMAVYGFCDIRSFTDTTELLQEEVMIFVNEIAEVVHGYTSEFCGSANKNIGDAFLLVWKFEEKFVEKKDNELKLIKNNVTSQMVDMALIAFLKIIAAVHKSYKLDRYRHHQKLKEIPNYSVKMGFGLHLGYSIEGAIGSMFKIDASYLSPNVNMSSKLEEKTKDYKVQLILSDDFVYHLSDDAKKYVRLIDRLKSDSKVDPLTLYTVDFDLSELQIEDKSECEFNDEDLTKKMEKIKQKREKTKKLYDDIINEKVEVWNHYINTDSDWTKMRIKFSPEFYEYYELGLNFYFEGNWTMAQEMFLNANSLVNNEDGPINRFLKYMEGKNFEPDENWDGIRDDEHGH